ncbi:glycosyltransferase [Cesiribacter sp. SM1]|uniref:glycosyltransferase n=1 Tax=Cesiribacter sp. SM1 TaxID=2861196 RepID=UPI001CD4D4F7|nr:glycosyltransferase [Cesiribacter sp. SM1]
MKMLRVIANMTPTSGGPCQGLRNSIPELKKLGVDNEVVSLDDPAAPYLNGDEFPVHALGLGTGPWYYNPKLVPWLLNNFARFDAVIVHGLWLYPSYAVLQAIELFRKQAEAQKQNAGKIPRFFIMPHGMLDPYFQKSPDRKIKALRNIVYWKLIEGKVVNKADALLFTCEEELQLAREPFKPYSPKQEINVGYGVAAPPAYTQAMKAAFIQKHPELAHEPYILFLSRIHEKKGVNLLISAYATLLGEMYKQQQKIPKLVIAGPGLDTTYGKKMQLLASRTSLLQNSIFFTGMLQGDAKWGAFYGSDVFVLPSHQENFGIAVVEAMACGKPVLISNQVNIWREIMAGGGGMVAPDSLEGTVDMLSKWIHKSPAEKLIMGKNAFHTYEQKFSNGKAARHFLQKLKPLL